MSDPRKQGNELALVDSFSKIVAVSGGLLYIIGFLVVAGHLSRYGVSGSSVLQLQYLIAGVWAIGPPVALAWLVLTRYKFEERATPDIPGRFNWRRFLISSLLTGIPFGICIGLLSRIPGIWDNLTWGLAVRLYLFYIAMVNCAQILWMSWRIPSDEETRLMNRRHAAPFYLSLLFTIVLGYVLWFSVRIYPLIPFSLGGGRPLTIVFLEGEKKLPEGIKTDTSSKRSIPYKLLVATEKLYVVLSPERDEKSIEVSRDAVAGIVVLEEPHAP
jgi:hypothetical protein